MRLYDAVILLILVFPCMLFSQDIKQFSYTKASDLGVYGAISPAPNIYHRIDTIAYPGLPPSVKHLLTHAAGLFVSFKTNSTAIAAKWCVTAGGPANNQTPIMQKGLDLYIKKNGKWQFASPGKPTAQCTNALIIGHMDSSEKECLLYLPLYDEVHDVEVGVEGGSSFTKMPSPFRKRILIYGSSILQGSSASRAGLAYPSIMSRSTGLQFINMGVSGNAKMEREVAEVIAATPADAYIMDCVPNTSPKDVTERAGNLVRIIRKAHPSAPIIMVQSIIRESGFFDQNVGQNVKQQNDNFLTTYNELKKEGLTKLYFISGAGLIGDDHEGTIDGTHPNDLGFDRMVKILQPQIMKILKKEGIY